MDQSARRIVMTQSPNIEAARTNPQYLEVLERVWGYQELLPLQGEAIDSIVAGRDSLVVLPTGGGKSLCYQLPALLGDDGVAVVVSPLISLMKDQVDGLVSNGVAAAYFNSSLTLRQQDIVAGRIAEGRYRLVYVAPERLVGNSGHSFRRLLERCGLRFVAVDEAHCISQWGHDFRPEYRQLGQMREVFPDISLHAFTATATVQVRNDIAAQLGLQQPEILVGSFDRPNLVYRARRRQGFYRQLTEVLGRHPGEGGIVYCQSRKEVEKIAERLTKDGYRAAPYHAGLNDWERHRNQEAFLSEKVDVVVATVAFGMGIDRSNVRYVVHAAAPRSLEHYQQEAGRAGRDGLEAECSLFYSPADFMTWRRMLASNGELTEHNLRQMRDMERYAAQTRCRHRALVEYFGQDLPGESCDACDWCLGELEAVEEPVVMAQKILSCVLRLRQGWGVGQVVDVLRGRRTEKVLSRGHNELSTFGLLEEVPVPELRALIDQLVEGGFLEPYGDPYPVLRVTPEGRRLLKGEVECALYRQQRPESRRRAAVQEENWEGVDRGLFERLRALRLELAEERGVPPYVIFHDRTLRALASRRPSDRQHLLGVPGIGEKKADDLGEPFLTVIQEYCAAESLSMDVAVAPSSRAEQPERMKRKEALALAYELFAQGESPKAVAPHIERAVGTTWGYLERYLEEHPEVSADTWLDAEVFERVRTAYEDPELGFERLKEWHEHFGGEVSYGELRVVRVEMKRRGGDPPP